MLKQFSKVLSVVLTMAVIMTAFAFVQPVSAEDIPDMEKANVMWDLQNNTQLKYKQFWYTMGAKTHTVKMTNYQVTDADTPGYKKCSFKLTWNLKVKPTKKQINKMGALAERGKLYTEWGFCVVDYQTGYSLGAANDKDVTESSTWKHTKYIKLKGTNGAWIKYPRKSVVKVEIIYPEDYKDLAIGTVASTSIKLQSADAHWDGEIPFSEATSLYSKKDPMFAHFMRVQ